jgi:mannosyltransferase
MAQRERVLLLLALLVGAVLRLFRLGGESLWYDETVSVFLAAKPVTQIVAHTAGDIHPPGYYLLLHLWQQIALPSVAHGLEFLYAWPSAAFGLLIIALLYPLTRRLFNQPVALLTVWLAAINPFQIWYGQEVRMYTLAGALALLCLWATLLWFDRGQPARWRWLLTYVLAATFGLYTLYYFVFVLAATNAVALMLWWSQRGRQNNAADPGPVHRSVLAGWLLAQVAVILLYSPWLPVLWRQASEPPVPVWRSSWQSMSAVFSSLSETSAAFVTGQSPVGQVLWPWALVTLLVLLAFVASCVDSSGRATRSDRRSPGHAPVYATGLVLAISLMFVFLPVLLIYLVSWLITPLYHVRYLFTYAPLFMAICAASVVWLAERSRVAGGAAFMALVAISLLGLREFWSNPTYRADDHRGAVAKLAANWRPGDLILANAGWVYTALEVYWPHELSNPQGALPPAIGQQVRLLDVANGDADPVITTPADALPRVTLVRAGSVDGDPTLGWGDPTSDFFAISTADTTAGLDRLAERSRRLWHYRLYDTVSDPHAVTRTWLEQRGRLISDEAIPGRDFLRVQLYGLDQLNQTESRGASDAETTFGDALQLLDHSAPLTVTAGTMLYAGLTWRSLPALQDLPVGLSMSLRLYDSSGVLLAQSDAAPDLPTDQWQIGVNYQQVMALAVPATAQPGPYTLELVAYRQDDASALFVPDSDRTIFNQRWQLQDVTVTSQ